MQPGLSETDCQIAMLRYAALVAEGQHQQSLRGMRSASPGSRPAVTAIRRNVGTLLVKIGQRIEGRHAVTSNRFGPYAIGERSAIA
jgi:hypothetical protein